MATLLEEFRQRRRLLNSLRYEDAESRLSGLFDWLAETPETEKILVDIDKCANIPLIVRPLDIGSWGRNPASARTLEEVTAVGIYIMQQCQEGKKLYDLTEQLGIAPSDSTGSPQDRLDEAMRRFIEPSLDFIETRLKQLGIDALLEERVAGVLTPAFEEAYPSTTSRLHKVAAEFSKSDEEGNWSNIGNSCRQILEVFSEELTEKAAKELPEELKKGDVKGVMRYIIGDLDAPQRFKENLTGLLSAVWDYAQPLTHRKHASKADALRAFIWTVLVISEYFVLLDSASK